MTKKLHSNNLIFLSVYVETMVEWDEWQFGINVDILWE